MNPRVSLLVLITTLFISCSTETREAPVVAVSESKTLVSELDSFYVGGNLLAITDTTESVFTSLYKFKRDTSETNCIKKDAELVSRHDDTLILKLENGTLLKLIDNKNVDTDGFVAYSYTGRLNAINYYLVHVSLYESFTYMVINSKTGKSCFVCGIPAISPNKKYLAASCCDLQAGFVWNGIEMYDVESDSLKLNWSRELHKWGADELVWLNDHNLIAKKQQLDSSSQNLVSSFIKLSCIGK